MAIDVRAAESFMATEIVLAVLTTFVPLLRFYALRRTLRNLNAVALVGDVLFAQACLTTSCLRWYDVYRASVERSERMRVDSELALTLELVTPDYLKYAFAESILHILILWLVKGAFLAFYWNLSARLQSRAMRYVHWGTAFILMATFFVNFVVFMTECKPISKNWDLGAFIAERLCSPYWTLQPQIILTVLTTVTDLLILCIPLFLISSLRLSRIEKRALPIIFLMGLLSITAPLLRFGIMTSNGAYAAASFRAITFARYHLIKVLSDLESASAIIAFSLPAFRFLLKGTCCETARKSSGQFSSYLAGWSARSAGSRHAERRADAGGSGSGSVETGFVLGRSETSWHVDETVDTELVTLVRRG